MAQIERIPRSRYKQKVVTATKKKALPAETYLCTLCSKPYKESTPRPESAVDEGQCVRCAVKENKRRGGNALEAVIVYAKRGSMTVNGDGLETVLSDMLCDLAHLCDQKGVEIGECLRRGLDHYNAESTHPVNLFLPNN